MVKRGSPIPYQVAPDYHNPHTDHREIKKFNWICEVCGKQYTYQGQAEVCEYEHTHPKPKLPTYAEQRAIWAKESEEYKAKHKILDVQYDQELVELRKLRGVINDLEYAKKSCEFREKWRKLGF